MRQREQQRAVATEREREAVEERERQRGGEREASKSILWFIRALSHCGRSPGVFVFVQYS